MQKFPLVRNLDRLKPNDFQNPESRVNLEDVVGKIEIGDSLSELLMAHADAGRPLVLNVVAVRRLDGVFIIAGELTTSPVNSVHRADTSATVKAADAEFVPIKAEETSPIKAEETSPAGNSVESPK